MEELRRAIAAALAGEGGAGARVNERQAGLLREAEAALERAAGDLAPELRALELRTSLAALGAITGRNVDEALLDRVFGRFCLGK
jgi:tRNA modification GTPase